MEPLSEKHIDGLVAAATNGAELYRWSPVPQTREQAESYIRTAISWREQRTAVPFVILSGSAGEVIGSTRFWQLEYWSWAPSHNRHGRREPDACEIGYTWFTPSAIRTGANTEAKFLMLTHAFEDWGVFRVCFHTDSRNERSISAISKLGATREGVLRAHRLAVDNRPRNSVRFSILAEDWPAIKDRLRCSLTHHNGHA
jgi:RimJ/RimL family protein N-acetyltransferase